MFVELIHDWHPLDGVPPPEYIPPLWDGPHVGKRLVDGLRILRHTASRGAHVGGYCSAWPTYRHEWVDWLAQQSAEDVEKQREADAKNWTRIIPSAEEIAHMEEIIGWPAAYLSPVPQLLRVVQAAAHARVRYRDLVSVARKLRLPRRLVRRWNRDGLDLIARGLCGDNVPVF